MHNNAEPAPLPELQQVLTPEFDAWLSDGGVRLTGVKASFVAEGWRGIVAAENIEPGKDTLIIDKISLT